MTELATPNTGPNDKGRFCPTCGGADIVASELAGGDASCSICDWKGKVEELATFHFSHDMGSAEQVFQNFFLDVRAIFSSQRLTEIGKVLLKWGFLDLPIDKKLFARYIGAMAKAMTKAIFDTRKEVEKERHTT